MPVALTDMVYNSRVDGITGANVDLPAVLLTNDAATTARINKRGLTHGCVENNTGAALTITWWAAMSEGGTAYLYKDQDQAAVTTVIAADDTIQELPAAIAGVPIAIPVASVAAVTVAMHLER